MADADNMPVFDKAKNDLAIDKVCELFDKWGLTLYERWHVCECIEMACLQAMGQHARDALDEVRKKDLEKVRRPR